MSRVFLPGFGLKPSMYSRLDLGEMSSCIDLHAKSSLDETITNLLSRTEPGSTAIGYSMGARLALASALREPNHFNGLVLVSLNAGISDIPERSRRFKADQRQAALFEQNIASGFSDLDAKDVFERSENDFEFITENRIMDLNVLSDQLKVLGLGEFDSVEAELMTLRIPVLFITGSRDEKYTALSAR